ncbi:alpha/beta hydrolase [Exilibacterium tricleocarpae]|uniref:Alpha/beta hydrolase n=1 Tax=Exilibacterium tricleocarpae TaxID=2591008 RepID=A0A545T0E7_9GAMM|nr:alpha/beta hydrolase [Exilibacterium tricleocarpae]TQV70694.1 alpha/beta hydrolase [Exilibacterium tricleocarpae]
MSYTDTYLDSEDNIKLFLRTWRPHDQSKAVVHIVHGLSEHSRRYGALAEFLNTHGYTVVAHDQRGHGRTAGTGTIGLFANTGGWQKVVDDVGRVQRHIGQVFPSQAVFLLGHSMGSYVSQAYLIRGDNNGLAGCILSGSNFGTPALFRLLRLIARLESWRQGIDGRSKLINLLSFGAFNKAFKPNRTNFDWLSRDPQQVDKYINDPLCGQLSTNQLWVDLMAGLIEITRVQNLKKIPAQLPVFIIGGERDPVSAGGRLTLLKNTLNKAGLQQVTLKLYPQARHEIFNETNRQQVYEDLLAWITAQLTAN